MVKDNAVDAEVTEAARLEALRRYEILDTPPEQELDALVELAASICEAPIAMITLVDENRQWFKSVVGLDIRETGLDVSICRHAILRPGLFVVPDTTLDPRFCDNPLVMGDPKLRFYAGALLETPDGHRLGTLCVLGHEARKLTEAQGNALTILARQVMTSLELRLARRRLRATLLDRDAQDDALRANEAFLQIASRLGKIGAWRVDLPERKHVWSDGSRAIHEVDENVDLQLDRMIEFYVPEHRPIARRVFEACARHGTPFDEELRLITAKGRERWVRVIGEAIADEAGAMVRAQGAIQDITERRRAQVALRRQATLLDKARDAILVCDLEGRVLYWNRSAERLYGWSSQEAVGRITTELICPDPAEMAAATAQTVSTGEWVGEIVHVTREGRRIEVEGRWSLVDDEEGQPSAILAINTDLTERKRLEQQFIRAQRMESVGTLAGGIAHDLNNALLPILMSVAVLREGERIRSGWKIWRRSRRAPSAARRWCGSSSASHAETRAGEPSSTWGRSHARFNRS